MTKFRLPLNLVEENFVKIFVRNFVTMKFFVVNVGCHQKLCFRIDNPRHIHSVSFLHPLTKSKHKSFVYLSLTITLQYRQIDLHLFPSLIRHVFDFGFEVIKELFVFELKSLIEFDCLLSSLMQCLVEY